MGRSLLAYLLIFTLIGSNFSRLFIYAGFKLNRDYIASKLCENRDKPWMHCNGKCYFMKKIKQAEEKEKNDEHRSQKNLFQEAFSSIKTEVKFQPVLLQVIYIAYNCNSPSMSPGAIFRPPQLG